MISSLAIQSRISVLRSSGSLITIVADNTRRTRSTITIQAMNKGLAAARFR
jgi:hypothetical protein